MELISFYSSREWAPTVVFTKATNSTLCYITINPPRLTHWASQKTKFMGDAQELQKYFKLLCNISCEAQYHR